MPRITMHVLSKTMRYYDSVAEISRNWRRTPREINTKSGPLKFVGAAIPDIQSFSDLA